MPRLWEKATAAADAAHLLYRAGDRDGACNRAYFAMFNAARALLSARGVDTKHAKTHATVLRLFSLHFVQSGSVDVEAGRAFADAGRLRNMADYSVGPVDPEAARDVIGSLDTFMAAIGRLIAAGEKPEDTR